MMYTSKEVEVQKGEVNKEEELGVARGEWDKTWSEMRERTAMFPLRGERGGDVGGVTSYCCCPHN